MRYWFANDVTNMANEQSKNNDIKLMEGRVETISKDKILEVIGKGKSFTLLKDLLNNKKEHLSGKFTLLVPNDIFVSSDPEDSTENENEDDSLMQPIEKERLWMAPVKMMFFQKD